MTLSNAIVKVTDEFLRDLDVARIKNYDDLRKLADELLEATENIFDEHNAICDKSKKWKMQGNLSYYQISAIMSKIFTFKRIGLVGNQIKKENSILTLYVNKLVVSLLPGFANKLGTYCDVEKEELIQELAPIFYCDLPNHFIDGIKREILRNAKCVPRCDNEDFIAVGNGIFNYKTKKLLAFNEDIVFLSKSPINYNPKATNVHIINPDDGTDWDFDSWCRELTDDPEIVELLRTKIPSALIRPLHRWNCAAMLIGSAGCGGKGSLLEAWRSLIGENAYCSIPLASFSKEFMLEDLIDTQAVLVDENDVGLYLDKCGDLKAVITNDVIQINRKNKRAIAFQFKGFMVQCLNDVPKVKDKSDSFYRRQLFIPMNKCFTGKERKYIKEDYLHRTEVLEYMLKIALESDFYELPNPQSCQILLDDIKEQNSLVRQYWYSFRDRFAWDCLSFEFLYDLFKAYQRKFAPSGTVINMATFKEELLNLLFTDKDDMWFCEDKRKVIYVGSKMSKPEPLILEYQLEDWMNKIHKGNNPDQICMPSNISTNIRGLQRIK